jgi:hypothetical protein
VTASDINNSRGPKGWPSLSIDLFSLRLLNSATKAEVSKKPRDKALLLVILIRFVGDDVFPLDLGEGALRNSGERTATKCRKLSIPTFLRERSANQSSRVAASASSASCFTTWKNFGVCPTNRPSLVNDAMVATAPPNPR